VWGMVLSAGRATVQCLLCGYRLLRARRRTLFRCFLHLLFHVKYLMSFLCVVSGVASHV
jgi:hypothetical protein